MPLRSEPPLGSFTLLHGDGWWGSRMFVLRGDPPVTNHELKESFGPAQLVKRVASTLPDEKVTFSRTRWSRDGIAERAVLIDGEETDLAVDVDYLDYADAETQPDEWRLVPVVSEFQGVVLGLRESEAVALIAPRKAKR